MKWRDSRRRKSVAGREYYHLRKSYSCALQGCKWVCQRRICLTDSMYHRSQVSRIWVTWLDFLGRYLRSIPIWPFQDYVGRTMPQSTKDGYAKCKVITDCVERFIETPSQPQSQSATLENCKHRIKRSRILKHDLPILMTADFKKIWVVCSYLCSSGHSSRKMKNEFFITEWVLHYCAKQIQHLYYIEVHLLFSYNRIRCLK